MSISAAAVCLSIDPSTPLRGHFSEREICELVWLVASEHLYNINNIELNIGSDALCERAATA